MSHWQPPKCDRCGSRKATRKVYRLDPRTWREEFSVRCNDKKCLAGWTTVGFERPARQGTYVSSRAKSDT